MSQSFLGGQELQWPYSSWDPKICCFLRMNKWIELIILTLIVMQYFLVRLLSYSLSFKCLGSFLMLGCFSGHYIIFACLVIILRLFFANSNNCNLLSASVFFHVLSNIDKDADCCQSNNNNINNIRNFIFSKNCICLLKWTIFARTSSTILRSIKRYKRFTSNNIKQIIK